MRKDASKFWPRGVFKIVLTDQYSRALWASICISRSTIKRRETDCTRPADFAPGNFRHKTGESLKPTK